MEVEGLDRIAETIFGQIPQPDGAVHDEVDHFGSPVAAPSGLRLDRGAEVHRGGPGRAGYDKLLQQEAPAAGFRGTLFEPVDDRRFDFMPGDALGRFFARRGAPIRAALALHPTIHHDDQAELGFAGRDHRARQARRLSLPSAGLDVLVDEIVAHQAAPVLGHRRRALVGADGGGGMRFLILPWVDVPHLASHLLRGGPARNSPELEARVIS